MSKKDLADTIEGAFADDEKDFVEPPKAGTFKLAQVGDFIKGKYLGSKEFEGDYGKTLIYSIEAEKGLFHEFDCGADEKPKPAGEMMPVEAGVEYGVFDHFSFHDQIKKVGIGQRIIIQFVDRKPSADRKGKFYKVISCKLDPKYAKPIEEGVGF